MSISSLKARKKSLAVLVLAMVMQVYQVQPSEMNRQVEPQVAPSNEQSRPQGSNISTQGTPSWGQSAYSMVSALPLKAQAGLAGLTTLGTGYSFYRGKLWWNKSKVLKNYSYLVTTFRSDASDAEKKVELIGWINNDYPRYQQAKAVTEKLRTPEQLEVIRFPFTVFKQELEQAIDSLGSDSWSAWAQGDKSVKELKTTLTAILTALTNTNQYKNEASHYAAYQQMTTIAEQDKRIRECNSRVAELLKQVTALNKELNKAK